MRLFKAALILLLALAVAGTAQEFRGKAQGFVTDSGAAAMAGVELTLLNAANGVAAKTKTNISGNYIFDFVAPGTYLLTGEMQGFSKVVQQNVTVPVHGNIEVKSTTSASSRAIRVMVPSVPTWMANSARSRHLTT